MNDLVNVTVSVIGDQELNSVNARDVWEFVESKQQFADWIKDRLEGFQESVDFEGFHNIMKNDLGVNVGKRMDYFLTLDTAKHICMIERNEKGKQLRQYFIDCEKKLREVTQPSYTLPTNFKEALLMLVQAEEEKEKLLLESAEQKRALEIAEPKVNFYDRFLSKEGCFSMESFAKLYNRKGLGRNNMFQLLRDEGFLIAKGNSRNNPYQKYVNEGYFKTVASVTEFGICSVTLVTKEGAQKLIKFLDEKFSDNWKERTDGELVSLFG